MLVVPGIQSPVEAPHLHPHWSFLDKSDQALSCFRCIKDSLVLWGQAGGKTKRSHLTFRSFQIWLCVLLPTLPHTPALILWAKSFPLFDLLYFSVKLTRLLSELQINLTHFLCTFHCMPVLVEIYHLSIR